MRCHLRVCRFAFEVDRAAARKTSQKQQNEESPTNDIFTIRNIKSTASYGMQYAINKVVMKRDIYQQLTTGTICLLLMAWTAVFVGCEKSSSPSPESSSDIFVGKLTLTPGQAKISPTNNITTFTAGGGTPPYRWSLSDKDMGSIPSTTAHAITYTRKQNAYGVNILTVYDRNDWGAIAVIEQPEN